MRPEHDARLAIIREWMALSKDKRQTEQQAAAFATTVMARVPSVRHPHQRIMRWLLPRIGRA
jgi:hypothetical protein